MKHLLFIPVFNCEKQILRVIDKILESKVACKFEEIIIIDNNSSDNTFKVVNSFKNIIYKKIKNKGVIGKSRNIGINLSKGKWLAFLDSDDYWSKNKLQIAFRLIKKKKFDLICHSEWILNQQTSNKKIWCYGPFTKNFYKWK